MVALERGVKVRRRWDRSSDGVRHRRWRSLHPCPLDGLATDNSHVLFVTITIVVIVERVTMVKSTLVITSVFGWVILSLGRRGSGFKELERLRHALRGTRVCCAFPRPTGHPEALRRPMVRHRRATETR